MSSAQTRGMHVSLLPWRSGCVQHDEFGMLCRIRVQGNILFSLHGKPAGEAMLELHAVEPARDERYVRRSSVGKYVVSLVGIFLLFALLPLAHASVDPINPTAGNATTNTTIAFDYYVSLTDLTTCSLNVNGSLFPDASPTNNGINTVVVQSIAPGRYSWNVTCVSSANATEVSATRELTVDAQAPVITVFAPTNGSQRTIPLDVIVTDDIESTTSCTVNWNNQFLESFTASANTHYARNYSGAPGNGTLTLVCYDRAGNAALAQRAFELLPEYSLSLSTDKQQYALTEPVRLTINSIQGANVTVDICPDQQGFVQCTSALITSTNFPQTITLPYLNKTSAYIVAGIARLGNTSRANQTRYEILNTVAVAITANDTPAVNRTIMLTSTVIGGIAPYRLTWTLSNGTTLQHVAAVNVTYAAGGVYIEKLTAIDAANNSKSVNMTLAVDARFRVEVRVVDNQTGQQLDNVDLDVEGRRTRTVQGVGAFDLENGKYDLFAHLDGYEDILDTFSIEQASTVTVSMQKLSGPPVVTITAPTQGQVVTDPVKIQYSAVYPGALTCWLFIRSQTSWYQQNGSTTGLTGEFTRTLGNGTHDLRVECTSSNGQSGNASVQFTISDEAATQELTPTTDQQSATTPTTNDEIRLQRMVEQLDGVLEAAEQYGPKEKDIIATIGFDKNVRNTKRAVQQAIRDINDLQFRNDLDESSKAAERTKLIASVDAVMGNTPLGISVTDSKTYIKYANDDDLEQVAGELAGEAGMTADPKRLARLLKADQQKFTVSTRVAHVDYVFDGQATKSMTVITRMFTYASNVSKDYHIYEVLPKEVSKSARELTLITQGEIVKEDPVLRFETQERISYIIPRTVDFTRAEDIKTVIARTYAGEASATGFAIFGTGTIMSLRNIIILAVMLLLIWAAWYFDVLKQVRFVTYRFGKQEKTHYLRVIINDAIDNLDANDYPKAEMLYREVRLTYDNSSILEKNDLYEDVISLVRRMDAYYFNIIMLEIDAQLKANNVEGAIHSYEKLSGTFERLDDERQRQLVAAVVAMGKRVGLQVTA